MPVDYTLDLEKRTVFTVATGQVDDDEFHEHRRRLSEDPKYDPSFDQFAELKFTDATNLTVHGIYRLAMDNPFGEGSRRAFVASSDLVFGFSRMYMTFTEGQRHDLRIFRDPLEARVWLGLE